MSGERQWQWQQQRQVCIVCHSACRPEHAVIALCVCDAKEGAFEGERERGSLTCTHISFCTLYPNLPLLAAFQSASTVCRSAAGIVGTSAGRAAHRHQNSSSSGGGNTQHGGRLSAQEEDAADTALQQWPATRATHSKDTVLVFWGGGAVPGLQAGLPVPLPDKHPRAPGKQYTQQDRHMDPWVSVLGFCTVSAIQKADVSTGTAHAPVK